MRRRKFIATSASLLGVSSITQNIGSQSVLGVTFNIPSPLRPNEVTSKNVVVTLSNIVVDASNLSDTSSDIILDVKADTDVSGTDFQSVKKFNININSGDDTIHIPSLSVDLGNGPDLQYANAEFAQLQLVVNHPDVNTSYDIETIISSGMIFEDGFDDGTLHPNYTIPRDQSIEEKNGYLYLKQNNTDQQTIIYGDEYGPNVVYEVENKIDEAANTGGYGIYFGFTSSETGERVLFEFPQYAYDNTWRTWTADSSGTNEKDTGDSTDGTWRNYRIEWKTDEVKFYINGTNVTTHTNNIPTSSLQSYFRVSRGSNSTSVSDAWWDNFSVSQL